MNHFYRIVLGLLLCAACSPRPDGPPPLASPRPLPPYVNVRFVQALIAPTKFDGRKWDGPGPIAPQAGTLIATALGASNAYSAVVGVLASPTISGIEPPEPFGRVRVFKAGLLHVELPLDTEARDTLTPIWKPATAIAVPLVSTTRIEIELWDRDFFGEHDPMGAAVITYEDLIAALRAGVVYHVRLAEQTNRQILFFDILVDPFG